MASPTPLLDRIQNKRRDPNQVIELRKQPRWIERMNAGQTKAKDLTGWRPSPDAA
jgi:hypothetical protein